MADDKEELGLIISAVNEATAAVNEVINSLGGMQEGMSKLGIGGVALGNVLSNVTMKAVEGLKNMVKLGLSEAIDAEQQQIKLAQSFRDQGEAAYFSIKAINEAANALGELIGVDNDVIVASAAIIRQLTGLSGEIIAKVLPAIGDLATKTGSYESAAILVARAINGQEMGLSKLGIKLDLTRDKTKNLDIVIEGLNKEFGGQAQANMQSMGGMIQTVGVGFADASQELGNYVVQSNFVKFAVGSVIEALSMLKNYLAQPTKFDPIGDIKNIDEAKEKLKVYVELYKTLIEAYNVDTGKNAGLLERIDLYDSLINRLKNIIKDSEANAKKIPELEKKEKDAILKIQDENLTIRANRQIEAYDKDMALLDIWHSQQLREEGISEERVLEINKEYALKKEDLLNEYRNRRLEIAVSEYETARDVKKAAQDQEDADQQERWAEEDALYYDHAHAIAGIIGEVAGASINTLSNSIIALLSGSRNTLDNLKEIWKSFGNTILSIITQLIAKLFILKTLMMLADIATGGMATALRYAAKAVLPGYQTPEGSTRIIPGPPNMPQLGILHGGERVGRGAQSGGGITLVVQGDYFESDEANGKLWERVHRYGKSIGA